MTPRKWLFIGSVMVAVLAMVALAMAAATLRDRGSFVLAATDVQPEPFESEGWNSGSVTRRIAMARYLTSEGELVGLTGAQLVARVGAPFGKPSERHWEWFLGERRLDDVSVSRIPDRLIGRMRCLHGSLHLQQGLARRVAASVRGLVLAPLVAISYSASGGNEFFCARIRDALLEYPVHHPFSEYVYAEQAPSNEVVP